MNAFYKTLSKGLCAMLVIFTTTSCAELHGPKGYADARSSGATNGPGARDPGTPGAGLFDAGVNTGSGEGADPIR